MNNISVPLETLDVNLTLELFNHLGGTKIVNPGQVG